MSALHCNFFRILGYPFFVLPTHRFSFSFLKKPIQGLTLSQGLRALLPETALGSASMMKLNQCNQTQPLVPCIMTAGWK